jgi:hypothetical protein
LHPPQGLQGLQAAQGLHGLQAAHGLHGLQPPQDAKTMGFSPAETAVGSREAPAVMVMTVTATMVSFNIVSISPLNSLRFDRNLQNRECGCSKPGQCGIMVEIRAGKKGLARISR